MFLPLQAILDKITTCKSGLYSTKKKAKFDRPMRLANCSIINKSYGEHLCVHNKLQINFRIPVFLLQFAQVF